MNNLKGFLQSGMIIVADPVYFSGDSREGADNSQCNPFENWDIFTTSVDGKDANMTFPGAFNEGSVGRGCVVQTGRISGQYEVIKEYNEAGNLSQIRIVFKD
jgi:hypothetical protein